MTDAAVAVQVIREAILEIEQHCPCGARPESLRTHPHFIGCPVERAKDALSALGSSAPVPQPSSELERLVLAFQHAYDTNAPVEIRQARKALLAWGKADPSSPAGTRSTYGAEVLCPDCAKTFCPHGEQLHFHHDGCPVCEADPDWGASASAEEMGLSGYLKVGPKVGEATEFGEHFWMCSCMPKWAIPKRDPCPKCQQKWPDNVPSSPAGTVEDP